MALNQTQRDHAIMMIDAALEKKTAAIRKPVMTKKQFMLTSISHEPRYSTRKLINQVKDTGWGDEYKINLFELFGCGKEYEDYIEKANAINTELCKDLKALAFELKGQVMFGNDFSVVEAALKRIEEL